MMMMATEKTMKTASGTKMMMVTKTMIMTATELMMMMMVTEATMLMLTDKDDKIDNGDRNDNDTVG